MRKDLKKVILLTSEEFGNKEVSITFTPNEENLINRRFFVPLIFLVEKSDKYYLKVWFRIKEVKDGKAYTVFDGIDCIRSYLQSLVYKGIKVQEIYINAETKDKNKFRIKYLITYDGKPSRRQRKEIAKRVEEVTKENLEKSDTKTFINNYVITNRYLAWVSKAIRKIYPPKTITIRKIERLKV